MRIFLFAITALIFSQQPASAFFYDGNELFRICRSDENFNSGLCLGIIIGAFDAYEISEIGPGVGYCAPAALRAGQLRDIVVQYLELNPADRHYAAHSLVWTALAKAYRCEGP